MWKYIHLATWRGVTGRALGIEPRLLAPELEAGPLGYLGCVVPHTSYPVTLARNSPPCQPMCYRSGDLHLNSFLIIFCIFVAPCWELLGHVGAPRKPLGSIWTPLDNKVEKHWQINSIMSKVQHCLGYFLCVLFYERFSDLFFGVCSFNIVWMFSGYFFQQGLNVFLVYVLLVCNIRDISGQHEHLFL